MRWSSTLACVAVAIAVTVVLLTPASAYSLVIDRVAGNLSLSVTPINEVFYGSDEVNLAIFNNLNESVDVNIDSKGVWVDDSSFSIPSHDTHITTFKFTKTFKGTFKYVISTSTEQEVVYQDVNVSVVGASLYFPKTVEVSLEEKSAVKKYINFVNDGDTALEVTISVPPSDALLAAIPDKFTLDPGDSTVVAYVVYGVNDSVDVPITYRFGDRQEVAMQKVIIKTTPMKEILQKEESLKQKEKELQDLESELKKLKLEGNVRLEVSKKGTVNKPVIIRVYYNNNPLANALLLVESSRLSKILTTGSNGAASFTPEVAGDYTVSLYSNFGEVVAVKSVSIARANFNLSISDVNVGETFRIVLPEPAELKVLKGSSVIFSGSGSDAYNVTLKEPGEYTVEFKGSAYEGKATFRAKGQVSITLIQGKKVVVPGQTLVAGKPIKVTATVGGTPVSGKIKVAYPANAYGYSERDIQYLMMQQMFMKVFMASSGEAQLSGMMFVPPNNILVEFSVNKGVAVIPLPDTTQGYLTITFVTDDGTVAGQYTFKVEKATPLRGAEPYIAGVLFVAVVVTFLQRKGVVELSVPDRLKGVVPRFRRKAEPPK